MIVPRTRIHSLADLGRLCLIVVILSTVFFCGGLTAQTKVDVSSLSELRAAVQKNDQAIVMKPGRYALTALPDGSRNLPVSGSNNTIDLSGVYVAVPVGATRGEHITISGNGNEFRGGTFEDIYKGGLVEIKDFGAYNRDRELAKGLGGEAVMGVTGNNNKVVGTKLTVRGSFPYGYGSIYGIGGDNAFGLNKRCGLVIKGQHNIVDGCEVQQRAFGHGIYMQDPADKTVIRNCLVEGVMRPSKDLYLETDPKDLPFRSNYKIQDKRNQNDGPAIPKDIMIPLAEDGIRVYKDGGSVTIENCTVKKMRGGIRLYLASHGTVINSTAIDCGLTNFNLPSHGRVMDSIGNFTFAPLINSRGRKSGQFLQFTVLPSPHALGPHNLADIQGHSHSIVFHQGPGPTGKNLRPIVVSDDRSTIRNETEYPITLQATASENTILSVGPVTDLGENNTVKRIKRASEKKQYRIWTSTSDVKVYAKLVSKKGSSVTLETVDGKKVTGPLRDLSKADRDFVADNSGKNSKAAKPDVASKPLLRTWTSTGGHKTKARMVSKKRDSVTLEKSDGSRVTVRLSQLSKTDRVYVDKN